MSQTQEEYQLEHGYAFRNVDVTVCPVGAIALYLWYRFDVQKVDLPLVLLK